MQLSQKSPFFEPVHVTTSRNELELEVYLKGLGCIKTILKITCGDING